MILRRFLSASSSIPRIVKSPLPDVVLPTLSIPDYIWESIHQWPDKVAIECGVTGRKYKYAEVYNLSRQFAANLRQAGILAGSTLSIIMPNTPEWPLVVLGALDAGLVITTANPAYTANELGKQLQDCDIHAVVTLSNLYPTVKQALTLAGKSSRPLVMIAPGIEPDTQVPHETVKLQEMLEKRSDHSEVRFPGSLSDTAFLPYSSGTTGLPKGVMLTHKSIVSNCAQVNGGTKICVTEPAIGSYQDVMPAVLPFFHIYGLSILMLSKMLHGIKLVTLPKFEPTSFYSVLERHQATVLYLAPPLLLFLGSHPGLKPKHIESLRYVISGAAPAGKLDVERFLKRAPKTTQVLQAYGMTETSPALSHMMKGCTKYDSVGVPVPNTEMKVIDIETTKILPSGEIGEVCVRGPQVMKGYFNRPEATKEILEDDGWLHTGDLGYYDNDGTFFVVDRLKELIKVKGFQVAPAELEEILRSHPDILDAAVVGVPDERSGEVPKAFVVLKNSNISKDDTQKFVAEKVSPHKQLKGGVQFIESIPKTPSGKILRRVLRELK